MQITPTPLPPILPRILLLLTFVTGNDDVAGRARTRSGLHSEHDRQHRRYRVRDGRRAGILASSFNNRASWILSRCRRRGTFGITDVPKISGAMGPRRSFL